jgi:hypothetical protein
MAQFFDFGEAAVPEAPLNVEGDLSAIQRSSDCAVHGLIRDVNIPVSSERYVSVSLHCRALDMLCSS